MRKGDALLVAMHLHLAAQLVPEFITFPLREREMQLTVLSSKLKPRNGRPWGQGRGPPGSVHFQ